MALLKWCMAVAVRVPARRSGQAPSRLRVPKRLDTAKLRHKEEKGTEAAIWLLEMGR